ncbi:MAG: hypothetical protein RMK57_02125 [Bryobacterales bacterium]|nr:hypothetical protein [Bryobacteraceae bacterium]MDW8353302.1 hypothetical protein [Bryobacterales bacterium]
MHHSTRAAALAAALAAWAGPVPKNPELVEVRAIWSRAPHNAFTDLIRYKERWYCVFREASAHVSDDGVVRVLSSADGEIWSSAAVLARPGADLRDPKLSVTPDHRLMLVAAAAQRNPPPPRHQTWAWFSMDGRDWGEPVRIGEPDLWLWRVTWHLGRAYGVGYRTVGAPLVRLYAGDAAGRFAPLVESLFEQGDPSECTLLFLPDHRALALLRRDRPHPTAQLGIARPPYRGWEWKDLGVRVGGPNLILLPDERIVAAGRLYDGGERTALGWLEPDPPAFTEFLRLPSGGDTSYPGLVWHDGLLWVSYYSSHEGKAKIYLAKVRVPPPEDTKTRRFVIPQQGRPF